jgi:hypothetical protein
MITASAASAPSGITGSGVALAMSVILVTPDKYQTIRKTIRALCAQTVAHRLEIIILTPQREGLEIDEEELRVFGAWQVIEVGPIRKLADVKMYAVRQANAPILMQAEDHSYPEPGWAENLIAAFEQGYAAVGPAVANGNPRTLLSWNNYLMHFGTWAQGTAVAGEVEQVPWHNSGYQRALLLDYGDDLPRLLGVESLLQEDLRRRGHRLYLAADVATSHINVSDTRTSLRHHFWGGRLYGASRAQEGKWPLWKRLVYIGGAPLIPLVRLPRLLALMERHGLRQTLLPRILWPMGISLLFHAAGEAAGYACGMGDAEERYSFFEMRRVDHLCREDREEELAG